MLDEKVCKLPRCSELFQPDHGNQEFCCPQHQEEDKLNNQKANRDPVRHFFPIMMRNNRQIGLMLQNGLTEVTDTMLEAYNVDVSLLRLVKPAPGLEGKVFLDSGSYFLITDSNFKTFKIQHHEPDSYTLV